MAEKELPKGPASLEECEDLLVSKLELLLPLLPAGAGLEMGRALLVDMRESAKTRRLRQSLDNLALKAKQSFNDRRSSIQLAMENGFKGLLAAYGSMLKKLRPNGRPKTSLARRPVPAAPKAPVKPDFVLLSASDLRKSVLGIPLAGQEPIRTTGNIWEGWAPSDSRKASDMPPKKKPDDNRT
jgi:hypothetical protein